MKGFGNHGDVYLELEKGCKCPNCELGKGLREAIPLELGLTGWENYSLLHCDNCGAYFASRGDGYSIMLHIESLGT